MSDSDISEVSARGPAEPDASGLHLGSAAHFPHHSASVADPSDVEEIVISENVRPAAARDAFAGTINGGVRRDPSDPREAATQSMSAYGLFPMQSKHALPKGERELSSVLACHMTRRELHRLLARARADRNQDMFDCYFLHEVVVESDAEVTSTESILCRACKTAIGAHGDSPLNSTGGGGTGDQIGGFGAISRPPRRPAILGPNHEITSGFSRPPIVGAGVFLVLAAIAATLLFVPGLPTRLPLLPVAASGLGVLLAALGCTALSTRHTIEFDTDSRSVRVTKTRAPLVCGCGSVQSWPFGDIAGVFISPDGPKAPGAAGSRSHREGRLPQFASYSVSLELYQRHTAADDDATEGMVVAPAKNPLAVDPAVGTTPLPGEEHEDSQRPESETAAAAAAWTATETVVLQRRVLSRDIAEVEADWQLFIATLTDSI